jgi:hypothetical protein
MPLAKRRRRKVYFKQRQWTRWMLRMRNAEGVWKRERAQEEGGHCHGLASH